MTQEEKAKAYDEALERMKSWVRGEHPECFTEAQKAAEFIFPELKESDDEKMMNQLHSWMKEFGGAEEYTEKVYQWIKGLLEKQGDYDGLVEEIIRYKKLFSKEILEEKVSINNKLSLGGKIAILEELLAFIGNKQAPEDMYNN